MAGACPAERSDAACIKTSTRQNPTMVVNGVFFVVNGSIFNKLLFYILGNKKEPGLINQARLKYLI